MYLWNKVLVGLIGLTAVFFFYLAGQSFYIHSYWQQCAVQHEQAIQRVKAENLKLREGDGILTYAKSEAPSSIRQVKIELDKLLQDRGRAWFQCEPRVRVGRDDGTAEVTATIPKPEIHGIAEKTILYAFEGASAEQKGKYLGEFRVTKTGDRQVTFVPTSTLSLREVDRLATAKSPWTLYEVMPRDGHAAFAGLTEEEMKAILPAESVGEYLKDGQPLAENDPRAKLVDGKPVYVRRLRDYKVLFNADRNDRVLTAKRLAELAVDTKLVEEAVAKTEKLNEAYRSDIATANKDLQEFARQRDLVVGLLKNIEGKFAEVQDAITRLIEKNQAMAGRIAAQQLEAARRIDDRTRAMAQAGTGG